MTPEEGARLGKYRLLRRLGTGGMASVWEAVDETLDRPVAIKTILSGLLPAEGEHLRARFLREARTIARLQHPHIVPVYEFGEEDGTLYLAMPLLAGGNLLERLRRPFEIGEAITWLRGIADALDHAHSEGVVHRDIKPANVLFDVRGTVHLADFGIAKPLQASRELTDTGAVLGTPHYMSPEQAKGEAVDGRSDQCSLGMLAYRVFTGRPPFSAESGVVVLHKIIYDDPPKASSSSASVPPEADSVFDTVLAKEPARRYPSCQAFVDALEGALRATATKPLPRASDGKRRTSPGPPPAREGRRSVPRWGWFAAASGLVLAISAVFVRSVQRPGERTGATAPVAKLRGRAAEPVASAPVLPVSAPRARDVAPPTPMSAPEPTAIPSVFSRGTSSAAAPPRAAAVLPLFPTPLIPPLPSPGLPTSRAVGNVAESTAPSPAEQVARSMGSPPDRVAEPSRPTYPFGKPGDLGSPVAGARPTLESVKAPQLRLGIDSTCYVIEIVTGTRVVRPGPRELRLESLTAEGDGPGRSLLKPNTAFFLPCLEPGADSVIALLPVDDLDGRLGLKDRVAVGFRVNDKKRSASVTPVDATGWLASLTDQQKGIDARRPPDASVFVRGRTDRSKARGAVLLRFGEQGAVVSSVVLEAFQVEGRALTSVPAAGLRLEPEGQMRFRTGVELALPAALVEELVLLVASGSPNQFGYPQVRAHLRLRLGDSVVEQDVMVNGWVEALRRPTATPARR